MPAFSGDRGPAAGEVPVRVPSVDPLGLTLVLAGGVAAWLLPLVVVKTNRIASGAGKSMLEAASAGYSGLLVVVLGAVAAVALLDGRPAARLAASVAGLMALLIVVGAGAAQWVPPGDRVVRVAPGAAAWLLLLALGLMATDALARLKPAPAARVAVLAVVALAFGTALRTGLFDHVSILREYITRAELFDREARQHLVLALGSAAAAALVGVPLGLACHGSPRLRSVVLPFLAAIQTIPSIALFGLLMMPLAFVARTVPFATDLGLRGIGAAPALVALFLYALLPVAANTALGLAQVPPAAVDAAYGMGMTATQTLVRVEMPLAAPAILTGLRIVLVQNIGLAAVAALIGGGGFGTFIFQGVGQTAMDLVLLGAVPVVALAFAAAVVLDAAVDALAVGRPSDETP